MNIAITVVIHRAGVLLAAVLEEGLETVRRAVVQRGQVQARLPVAVRQTGQGAGQ